MDWLRRLRGNGEPATTPAHGGSDAPVAGSLRQPPAEVAAPFRRTAFVPTVVAASFRAGSGFGGQPYLAPGVSNPICPQCGLPMPLIAQVALDAQPAAVIAGTGLFQLFYCTREVEENPCDDMLEGWAPFSEGHVSRLVDSAPGGTAPEVDTPFKAMRVAAWTPVDDYPNWEELGSLGVDVGEPPNEAEPSPLEGEKLGGWPAWIQGIEYPDCPRCGARMELVLQIDSAKILATMWGDMGIGHVTQCPNDPDVLTFAWACS